jgi:hypothetical protein
VQDAYPKRCISVTVIRDSGLLGSGAGRPDLEAPVSHKNEIYVIIRSRALKKAIFSAIIALQAIILMLRPGGRIDINW